MELQNFSDQIFHWSYFTFEKLHLLKAFNSQAHPVTTGSHKNGIWIRMQRVEHSHNYSKMLLSKLELLQIWDSHDYGHNQLIDHFASAICPNFEFKNPTFLVQNILTTADM